MRSPAAAQRFYSTPNARRWQARLLPPAALLFLTLVYFWPQVVQGRVLYWGDISLYFTPMAAFLRDNLNAGRIPLWNPLIDCGTPYAGNPQTWPLYPLTALLPFVSAPYFFNLTVALHVWLAGVGTYLFARQALGIGCGAALLAAVTFMFGGQLVSKEQFPNMVQAAAWLPWVLWALDRLLHQGRLQNALAVGLILGLQLLAAHPQMTLLTLYLAAAWSAFAWTVLPGQPWRQRGKPLLLSLLVALGLAAGQLLPTVALFRDAARQKLGFAIVNRFYLPPNELFNFVLPRLHGHPFFGDWTARGNFWETCCYVGWVPFGLAVWGGVAAWRKDGTRTARFWTGVFVFGVGMALGGRGGLYHLAFFVLPGFRAFHDPARCLLWTCFALSLLAGYGLHQVRARTCGPALVVLLLAFADLASFGRTLYPLTNPAALFPRAPNIADVQADADVRAHQARILAPTAGVWLRFTSLRTFGRNEPGYQLLWADTLTPNLMMPYGLRDAFGYEPVALKNAQKAGDKAAHGFDPKAKPNEQQAAAERAGALAVKYIAVCRVAPPEKTVPGLVPVRAAPTLAPPGKKDGAQAKIYLSRNARWQPRARVDGSLAPVTLSEAGPDQVGLTCVTAAPARLVLADTRAAGWQAAVDGRPAPIEASGGSLRAVTLPTPGAHRVVFSYRPTAFRLGLYLSLLTLGALAGAAAFAAGRNVRRAAGFGHASVE